MGRWARQTKSIGLHPPLLTTEETSIILLTWSLMTTSYSMEIDMSFRTATRRFAAISYEVDDLRLDAGGFAGLVFIGQLYIEPDTSTYCESW